MRLALSLIAVLALVPATARAATADDLSTSQTIAQTVFPYACGQILPFAPASDGVDNRPCVIYLQRDWRALTPYKLCTEVVHMRGLLAGLKDNDNPRSIMYRHWYSNDSFTYRHCGLLR